MLFLPAMGLWHSGSANITDQPRWFVSVYLHVNWLPPRDNHHGPNFTQLRKQAFARTRTCACYVSLSEDPHRQERSTAPAWNRRRKPGRAGWLRIAPIQPTDRIAKKMY